MNIVFILRNVYLCKSEKNNVGTQGSCHSLHSEHVWASASFPSPGTPRPPLPSLRPRARGCFSRGLVRRPWPQQRRAPPAVRQVGRGGCEHLLPCVFPQTLQLEGKSEGPVIVQIAANAGFPPVHSVPTKTHRGQLHDSSRAAPAWPWVVLSTLPNRHTSPHLQQDLPHSAFCWPCGRAWALCLQTRDTRRTGRWGRAGLSPGAPTAPGTRLQRGGSWFLLLCSKKFCRELKSYRMSGKEQSR